MSDVLPAQVIEVNIGGRRYKITLDASFSQEAIDEIKDTFHLKEIAPLELFKAYLNKVRDTSELNAQLRQLLNKIP
ncbi:hypothetical protein [Helicobacter felis]|uniref:Uncharacterized protein n=1 Tax=Helicobacter felis (strain ATCC 49179 / CCUG 28539 / NCTC 12436 / CS1) TaxID=936155 RepID=E7AA29_HELFC|nr:hypothetical protein [Helicobacter felis]CBY83448.1 Putative hypothetical protein [Helicobacter felis ATCC 49179]